MNNSNMKNSLTQNDLKCGMIAYEVNKMCIRTVMFVSDVYTHSDMGSKCIDYKSFYIRLYVNNNSYQVFLFALIYYHSMM